MKLKDLIVRLQALANQDRDVIILIDGLDLEILIEGDPEAVDIFLSLFTRSDGKEIDV